MGPKSKILVVAGLALAGCHGQVHQPSNPQSLDPNAARKAEADLLESIENYSTTAPKKRVFRSVLNPNMEALQGDPDEPVPSNIGLLKAVPPPPRSGLEAFSPIVVKAVQARLRDSLHREPTVDEIANDIAAMENRQIIDISDELESRRAEIAGIYTDIAALNRQQKTDEARQKLAALRMLRRSAIASWYQAHGMADGKSDTPQDALSPEQAVTANRGLLLGYLNNAVTESR